MHTPLPATAADYFGAMRESYDSLIRRAVPRYDELTACLVDYLPPAAGEVLELGCGTGNLSLALAARYPAATLTLVDASAEMVELTRARMGETFPAAAARAHWLPSRFEDLRLESGRYDLITSSFSLHHVRDKAALYRALHAALRPGGTLRFADQLLGGSPENQALHWARWLHFCREPGHCSEAEIRSLLDHAREHDHYVPLAEHFRLLTEAGFVQPDCVWRAGMWGVITADAA